MSLSPTHVHIYIRSVTRESNHETALERFGFEMCEEIEHL